MTNDSLFELIRSLSTHEKGYFRKFSKIYSDDEEKNYIELFDFIDKMEGYDEKAIKREFKDRKWLGHLSVLKKYLFGQILKSLESYQSSTTKDAYSLFRQSTILTTKGLFKESLEMIKSVQEVCERKETYYLLLNTFDQEAMLIKNLHPPKVIYHQLRILKEKEKEVIEITKDLADITSINDDLFDLFYKKGSYKDAEIIKEVKGMMNDALIHKIKHSNSITYKRIGFSALMMYYQLMNDLENAYIYSRELYYLSERHNEFFTKYSFKSSIIIYNYLFACIQSKHFIEFEENIKTYEDQKLSNEPQVKSHKFHMLHALYFSYILTKKDYPLFLQYNRKFEKEYKLNVQQLNPWYQANLICQAARLYYLNGRVDEAVEWNNIGLKLNSDSMREESKVILRLQDIIFHFDMGRYQEVESKLFSARRNLRNNSPFFKTEQCIISYMYQLVKADEETSPTQIFKRFKKDLKDIFAKNSEEQSIIQDFDFIEWIDTKVKQVSDRDGEQAMSIVA